MAQPPTIIDAPVGQTVKLGALLITFAQAGQLVAEEVTFDKGFVGKDYKDNAGITTKAAYSPSKGGGSMTIQFRTASDGILTGDTFSLTGVACIVTKTGPRYTQNGASKIQIEYAERMSNPSLGQSNLYDGDFFASQVANNAAVTPVGPLRFEHPIPKSLGALVIKQRFAQNISGWTQQNIGTTYPGNPAVYLVSESPLEDSGVAGIVEWDRTYATIPATWSEKVAAVKTFKYLLKAFNGTLITSATIVSTTRPVSGTAIYEYSLSEFSASQIPDVAIWFLSGSSIPGILYTGGFPFTNDGVMNSNEGFYPVSCELGSYMGLIYYRKQVWAGT